MIKFNPMYSMLPLTIGVLMFSSLTQCLVRDLDCFCRERIVPKMFNAVELHQRETVPWVVSLGFVKRTQVDDGYMFEWEKNEIYPHFCTGIIVNEEWILTAASCLEDMNPMFGVGYGINLTTIYSRPPIVPLRVVLHPKYNPERESENNVALIQLSERIDLSNYEHVQAACLGNKTEVEDNALLHMVGFGAINKVTKKVNTIMFTNRLRRIYVQNMYKNFLSNSSMIARSIYPSDSGPSLGDCGGPLQKTLHGYTEVLGILVETANVRVGPAKNLIRKLIFLRFKDYLDWIKTYISNNYCILDI